MQERIGWPADAERPRLVEVPKPGGVRRLTRLDPRRDLVYGRLVARLAPRVEASLGDEVVANRVRWTERGTVRLECLADARGRLRREVGRRSRPGDTVAFADVRDCYGRIGPDRVARALARAGCHPAEVGAVRRFLEDLRSAGIEGLPVGPPPSAVLANAVLAAADERIRATGGRHVRWVDDFVLFAETPNRARALLSALARALDGLGLELAPEKTRLVAPGPTDVVGLLQPFGSRVG